MTIKLSRNSKTIIKLKTINKNPNRDINNGHKIQKPKIFPQKLKFQKKDEKKPEKPLH